MKDIKVLHSLKLYCQRQGHMGEPVVKKDIGKEPGRLKCAVS